VAARQAVEAFSARALKDVIVLEVPARGLEIAVALPGGVAVARAEEIVLELGRGERAVAMTPGRLDLPAQITSALFSSQLARRSVARSGTT
jgi:hypothetical protein